MRRLHVGRDAKFAQSFRCDWPDRSNDGFPQAVGYLLVLSYLVREAKEMMDLHRRGEEHDVEITGRQVANGFLQWIGVFRRRPFVHWNRKYRRSCFGKSCV